MTEPIKRYLGDGLYAEFDGWQIRLYAERGPGIVHEVFLEPSVYNKLRDMVEDIRLSDDLAFPEKD